MSSAGEMPQNDQTSAVVVPANERCNMCFDRQGTCQSLRASGYKQMFSSGHRKGKSSQSFERRTHIDGSRLRIAMTKNIPDHLQRYSTFKLVRSKAMTKNMDALKRQFQPGCFCPALHPLPQRICSALHSIRSAP